MEDRAQGSRRFSVFAENACQDWALTSPSGRQCWLVCDIPLDSFGEELHVYSQAAFLLHIPSTPTLPFCLSLGWHNTPPQTGQLQQQKLSLTVLESGTSQIRLWQIPCVVRTRPVAHGWPPCCRDLTQRKGRGGTLGSCSQGHQSSSQRPPHHHLPKALSPNTVTLGIGLQHLNLGKT